MNAIVIISLVFSNFLLSSCVKVIDEKLVKSQVLYEKYLDPKTRNFSMNPVACVNPELGLVYPGTIYNTREFQYRCSKDPRGSLSLDVVACLGESWEWRRLEIGEHDQKRANGTLRASCDFYDGKLTMSIEHVRGCYYNETVYPVGSSWTQPNPNDTNVAALQMSCEKINGYFENVVTGCIYSQIIEGENYDTEIPLNSSRPDYGKRCFRDADGFVRLQNYTVAEENCKDENGTVYKNGEDVEDEKRYGYCRFGVMEWTYKNCFENSTEHLFGSEWVDKKTGELKSCGSWMANPRSGCWVMYHGCMVKDKLIQYGEKVMVENGCEFTCDQEKRIYRCEQPILGLEVVKTKINF